MKKTILTVALCIMGAFYASAQVPVTPDIPKKPWDPNDTTQRKVKPVIVNPAPGGAVVTTPEDAEPYQIPPGVTVPVPVDSSKTVVAVVPLSKKAPKKACCKKHGNTPCTETTNTTNTNSAKTTPATAPKPAATTKPAAAKRKK